jgi:hypothetical protein
MATTESAVDTVVPAPLRAWPRGRTFTVEAAVRGIQRLLGLTSGDQASAEAALGNLASGGWLRRTAEGWTRPETDPAPAVEKAASTNFTLRVVEGYSRPKRIQLDSGEWVMTLETEQIPTKYFNHNTGQEIEKPSWA